MWLRFLPIWTLVLHTALGYDSILSDDNGKPIVIEAQPDTKIYDRDFTYTPFDWPPLADGGPRNLSCRNFPDGNPSYPKILDKDSPVFPASLANDPITYLACCAEGLHLSGDPVQKVWDCCSERHELTGPSSPSSPQDYRCCPANNIYRDSKCQECTGGQINVNNDCQCPQGQVKGEDGSCHLQQDCQPPRKRDLNNKCVCPDGMVDKGDTCELIKQCKEPRIRNSDNECVCRDGWTEDGDKCVPPRTCPSGIEPGQCYMVSRDNGQFLDLGDTGEYVFSLPDARRLLGRIQICTDENCTSAPDKTIQPGDRIYLRDTFNQDVWLDGSHSGAHISMTTDFHKAGEFSLTKWSASQGSYCLGGYEGGIGAACASETPGITFLPDSPQTCFPVILTKVPCDSKDPDNDCVWESQGAGKVASNEW
ncbi:hypothetical protein BJY04DRAFT_222937 [Aspergillus karnatakaensis]|uniref:cysteine-rich secreted protein n=1 Tax=Aspergillus karnatakaensis TaxID=1810916 RepID=UPI003CCDD7B1